MSKKSSTATATTKTTARRASVSPARTTKTAARAASKKTAPAQSPTAAAAKNLDEAAAKSAAQTVPTAGDANVKVNPVRPNRKAQGAVAAAAKAEDREIVEDLTAKDTRKEMVEEILRDIRQEQPYEVAKVSEKEMRSIITEEVEKELEGQLEDRSTEPMVIARVKTIVKTRFAGLVAQANNKGSDKTKDAAAALQTSTNSPLPISPESQLEMAKREPDLDAPARQKAIEKEQKRLAAAMTGAVASTREMIPERLYHFSKKQTEEDAADVNIAPEQFAGRFVGSPRFGTASVSVMEGGRENGRIREVALREYEVREISHERAFELSLV